MRKRQRKKNERKRYDACVSDYLRNCRVPLDESRYLLRPPPGKWKIILRMFDELERHFREYKWPEIKIVPTSSLDGDS
jgi:hypothetical protein